MPWYKLNESLTAISNIKGPLCSPSTVAAYGQQYIDNNPEEFSHKFKADPAEGEPTVDRDYTFYPDGDQFILDLTRDVNGNRVYKQRKSYCYSRGCNFLMNIGFLKFGNHSIRESQEGLADFLPDGILFESKNIENSNFQRLLKGFAGEIFNAEGIIRTTIFEYDIRTTTAFIEEWEGALGIPDLCFSNRTSLPRRRLQCLVKLVALGVQSRLDFIRIGEIFGLPGITIAQAIINPATDPWTVVITYPAETGSGTTFNDYEFNFPFDASINQLLRCLYEEIAPINVQLIHEDLPP